MKADRTAMTAIVTGASGQLGRSVAELLLDDDAFQERLVLITRSPPKLDDLAARGAEIRHGDFDDPSSLAAAFAGGERLLLVSMDRLGVRVAGHHAAIDAAQRAGIGSVADTSNDEPFGVQSGCPRARPSCHGGIPSIERTGLDVAALQRLLRSARRRGRARDGQRPAHD